ncbi:transposase [Paenibacillus macerans]|nr:transposase [Paenibacillus macerans]
MSERRTKADWAEQVRELPEVHYPKAKRVRFVMDNLNSHTISSLYETFNPDVPLSLAKRLKIYYPPKHGSWPNIAEIELSALMVQCLHRRIGFMEQFTARSNGLGSESQLGSEIGTMALYDRASQRKIKTFIS